LKAPKESEQAIKLDPNLAWVSIPGGCPYGPDELPGGDSDFNKALELEPRYAWLTATELAYFMLKTTIELSRMPVRQLSLP